MSKQIIHTQDAPQPVGPYSQAVLAGDTLYISGQVALDAVSGVFLAGSVEEQTDLVMKNLQAVLHAAEMNFEHAVKVSIFLTDMSHFDKVNGVYQNYFDPNTAPARETIAVKTLPKNALVEISMIAVK